MSFLQYSSLHPSPFTLHTSVDSWIAMLSGHAREQFEVQVCALRLEIHAADGDQHGDLAAVRELRAVDALGPDLAREHGAVDLLKASLDEKLGHIGECEDAREAD